MSTYKLYRDEPYREECEAEIVQVTDSSIFLNQTVFYGEAGGQVGDSGFISNLRISDTQHVGGVMLPFNVDRPSIKVQTEIQHISPNSQIQFAVGDIVKVKIDWERRYKIMQMHSAGHLVYFYALKFFGSEGKGLLRDKIAGCKIDEESARFDFITGTEKLTDEHLKQLEETANALANQNLDITYEMVGDEPDLRYWRCGEVEMYCGGTHVRNTRELGKISVHRRSKGKNLQRIYLTLSKPATDLAE